MKAASIALLFSLPLALIAAEVRTGDSFNDVRANLGQPKGQVKVGDRQVLFYDRGEVELRAGVVSRVNLLSEADFNAQEAKRVAAEARRNEENAKLNVQGETLKAQKLADGNFLAAPLSYQLAFWQDFSRRFPGVSVSDQLAVAHMRLAEQYAQRQANEERIAELEARANDAEARADAVEYNSAHFAGYVDYAGYGYGYYRRDRHASPDWPIRYNFASYPSPVISPGTHSAGAITHNYSPRNSNPVGPQCDSTNSNRRGRM